MYQAEHRRMRRKVALKMISPAALEHPEALQRFHREAQAMARMEHPNIVTAHDADQAGDINFLVMQYVDGDDLATMVKNRGALPVDLALSYMVQTARGLEYAHQEGVIHRDIKPSNLIVGTNGLVKILDMGLARLEDSLTEDSSANRNLTQAGNIMGTIDFMAPEQALDAKEADQRADIYSLGCTFYYLLTGQTPYAGDTMMKRIMSHRFDPVQSLYADRDEIPEGLDAVFQMMVDNNRADRFRTMTELLSAVAPYITSGLTGLDVAVPTPGHGTVGHGTAGHGTVGHGTAGHGTAGHASFSGEALPHRPATAVQPRPTTAAAAKVPGTKTGVSHVAAAAPAAERTSPGASFDAPTTPGGPKVGAGRGTRDWGGAESAQKSGAEKRGVTSASPVDESKNWRNQKAGRESSSRLGTAGRKSDDKRRHRMLGAVALYAGLLVVLVAAVIYMQADTGTLRVIHATAKVKELLADKAVSLRDVKTEPRAYAATWQSQFATRNLRNRRRQAATRNRDQAEQAIQRAAQRHRKTYAQPGPPG